MRDASGIPGVSPMDGGRKICKLSWYALEKFCGHSPREIFVTHHSFNQIGFVENIGRTLGWRILR
jgi:hypothetical protein